MDKGYAFGEQAARESVDRQRFDPQRRFV